MKPKYRLIEAIINLTLAATQGLVALSVTGSASTGLIVAWLAAIFFALLDLRGKS